VDNGATFPRSIPANSFPVQVPTAPLHHPGATSPSRPQKSAKISVQLGGFFQRWTFCGQ